MRELTLLLVILFIGSNFSYGQTSTFQLIIMDDNEIVLV